MLRVIENRLAEDEVTHYIEDHPDLVIYCTMDDKKIYYRYENGERTWIHVYPDGSGTLFYHVEDGCDEETDIDPYGDGSDLLVWRNTNHRFRI